MPQLKRLSLVATLCFLGAVGVAQVTRSGNATSSATLHHNPTSTKVVVLQCKGDNGGRPFTVPHKPNNPDTVIFATPPSCPLQNFSFDKETPPGFTPNGKDLDGNYVYDYDGTALPSTYPFSYNTPGMGGGGTGVIKN